MSADEQNPDEQVLGEDEEQTLSSLGAELEKSCQQLDVDALQGAGELLRREIHSLRSAHDIVEAQKRAEFVHRLSSIVTDACCKLETKMHVRMRSFTLYFVFPTVRRGDVSKNITIRYDRRVYRGLES